MHGIVQAVSCSPTHTFARPNQGSIRLLTGQGVEGDAHLGETVKHRSRVARDPSQPNLRQVHLIHAELHDELRAAGLNYRPHHIDLWDQSDFPGEHQVQKNPAQFLCTGEKN